MEMRPQTRPVPFQNCAAAAFGNAAKTPTVLGAHEQPGH